MLHSILRLRQPKTQRRSRIFTQQSNKSRLPRHDCVMNRCCAITRHERICAANVFLKILAEHSFRQSGWRVQVPRDSGQLVDLATFDSVLYVGKPCCQLSDLVPNTCTPKRLNNTKPTNQNTGKPNVPFRVCTRKATAEQYFRQSCRMATGFNQKKVYKGSAFCWNTVPRTGAPKRPPQYRLPNSRPSQIRTGQSGN